MSKWAFYHDFDELKCEVIREAIKARAITNGEVICGDIKQLTAEHVRGFRRVHCFAGGGFWDLALNLAGWGDAEVWTGSCPCPSFSAAGKGGGFDDPRHLWPAWFGIIRECKPATIFGEQADDAVGYGWLDLVQANLEAEAYAVGKIVFGAHSVGAPHIRQRIYFGADAEDSDRRRGERGEEAGAGSNRKWRWGFAGGRDAGECADADGGESGDRDVQRGGKLGLLAEDGGAGKHIDADKRGSQKRRTKVGGADDGWQSTSERSAIEKLCLAFDSADVPRFGRGEGWAEPAGEQGRHDDVERGSPGVDIDALGQGLQRHFGDEREWRGPGWLDPQQARSVAAAGATRGFWGDCDWWYGRDGKYRPIGPGLQPLAHGSRARVGRLRMYGDGIVVPQATEFIKAYLEAAR
jgi:DNA (cytosine-5)-methyltransferase 1